MLHWIADSQKNVDLLVEKSSEASNAPHVPFNETIGIDKRNNNSVWRKSIIRKGPDHLSISLAVL